RHRERTVDLYFVQREGVEVTEARISRAKIVQGDANAHRFDRTQYLARRRKIMQQRRFGDLHFQSVWTKARGFKSFFDHIGDSSASDLQGRQIDGDKEPLGPRGAGVARALE